jgi:hypothetical protein
LSDGARAPPDHQHVEAGQRELARLFRSLGLPAAASAAPGFRVTMAQ